MGVIRDELHRAARLWNNHRIRPSTNCESPGRRPDLLFSFPEISGTRDFIVEVDKDDITPCQQLVCDSNSLQLLVCTPEFSDLANIMPNSLDKARNLYNALISHIGNIRTDKMHQ